MIEEIFGPPRTELLDAIRRVEKKLDHLIKALGEQEEEEPIEHALDGTPLGQERDQNEPL